MSCANDSAEGRVAVDLIILTQSVTQALTSNTLVLETKWCLAAINKLSCVVSRVECACDARTFISLMRVSARSGRSARRPRSPVTLAKPAMEM